MEKPDLDDPRAVDILTTEHWSLLSTRNLGYQEMFGRTTIFVATVSGSVVALALLGEATAFGRQTLWLALLLIAVAVFVGIATFARCLAINRDDARCVKAMDLLRKAYVQMVPGVGPFLMVSRKVTGDPAVLGHGSHQRVANLGQSLTTTSSVVATLTAALAGALASDVGALCGTRPVSFIAVGVAVSLLVGGLQLGCAARFRRRSAESA
jgi:hypothetical protein